ncbi:MAG: AAA family ATPase [bacterium]
MALPLNSNNNISVRIQVRLKKLQEELEEIVAAEEGFYIPASHTSKPIDLLIMDIGGTMSGDKDKAGKEFDTIKRIISSGEVKDVFLTSPDTNPDVLIRALRDGVREFLPQPIVREDLRNALARIKERKKAAGSTESAPRMGKIINVLGSKGGVGATTIAVNLAASLMKLEDVKSTLLIDLNTHFGEVPFFFGIEPAMNWMDLIKNVSRLDVTYLQSAISQHPSGVSILPAPSTVGIENKINPREIRALMKLICSIFDYIVIDSGQSIDENAKEFLRVSDIVLLIAVANLPSLINVKKMFTIFHDQGFPKDENVRILMNRYQKDSIFTVKEAEKSIDKKFFYNIPNDYEMTMKAINRGKPLFILDKKAKITQEFLLFSETLCGKKCKRRKKKKGFWDLRLWFS